MSKRRRARPEFINELNDEKIDIRKLEAICLVTSGNSDFLFEVYCVTNTGALTMTQTTNSKFIIKLLY